MLVHKGCRGEVALWSRRCKKCGKQWPLSALFSPTLPRDMMRLPPDKQKIIRRAKQPPKIPRWARIAISAVVIAITFSLLWIALAKL